MKKKKLKKHGFTLIEAMMGMTITGIVLVGVISSQMGNYKAVEKNKDAIFAQNKAVQIIEELRSVVKKGESAVNTLDTYDNKDIASPILTTDDIEGITVNAKAANQISGNRIQNGKWRFVRDVKVRKSPDSPKSRTVTVSIYYADANGNPVQPPLATLSTILSSAYGSNLPTQVMDTYALAISNQPGWWSSLSSLKQTMQDSGYDLKVKNPGLDYRFHFITRSSFGRDPYYTPYCNKLSSTDNDGKIAFPYVYYGRITDTSRGGIKGYFYNPVDMISDGMRLKTDEVVNGASIYNTWYGARETPSNTPAGSSATIGKATTQVYSAADQYNHAVRGPEDIAINEKLKTYYSNQKPAIDYEPSYRKFIDDMYESDKETPIHRNLMITNLHGELFPTIPLRNYSDAAKSPSGEELLHDISSNGIVEKSPISNQYKRVVTHPEQLEYNATSSTKDRKIYLRVYPYLSDPTQTTANVDKIDTISLFIPTSKYVGAKTTATETQTLPNLPDFTIPNTTAVIAQIKNNIKFQYIDDDFVKRSNNYSAYVKITAPKQGAWSANFDPIGSTFDIKTGTGSTSKIYKFKVVARRDVSGINEYKHWQSVTNNSNVLNTSPNTDIDNVYKIVSCDLDKDESLTVPDDLNNYFNNNQVLSDRSFTNGNAGAIKPPSSGSSNTTITGWTVKINRFDDINNSYSDLGLDPTNPEVNPKIHTMYDGTYEIIVNPAFDRMGTGKKTINPGILIKLHGTGTKHTQKVDDLTTSTYVPDKGIPVASRLYGLDYIPSPLGKNMFRSGTTKSYPIKKVNGSSYYTDTFTDTIFGGSNNSDSLFGSNYGAYTGLYGRDLSDTGDYAKNTARWIISINIGNGNSNNSTNILSDFQNKMMSIETRIGENLNTGMSINQSPNPYDGTVKQTSLVPNPLDAKLTDYIVINPTDTAKSNGAYNCADNIGDCGSITEGFPAFPSASGATKPTLSNLNKNELSNLSRTYVWIGNSAENGIKESERYQMIGDIRHNPYVDTLEYNRVNLHFNTIVSGSVNDVGSASSLRNSITEASSVDYPNLGVFDDNTILAQNKTILDVSSFFHLFKTSLLASNSIYNSLIGYSFYYYGLGGEVGSNGNALNNGTTGPKGSVNFEIKGIPYNKAGLGQIGESSGDSYNEILESGNSPANVGARIIGNNNQSWGSIPWIGELYPDSDFGEEDVSTATAKWANTGNLPSELSGLPSTKSNRYSRQLYTTGFKNITPTWAKISGGSYWAYSVDKIEPRNRLNAVGSQMFFHGSADGDNTKSFNQTVLPEDAMVQGKLTPTTGTELVSNYGLIMPSIIDVARPFSLVGSSAGVPKIPSNTPLWNMYNTKYSKLYFLGDGFTPNPTTTTPGSEAVFYDAGITADYSSMAGSAPVMIDGSGWKSDPYGTGRNKGYVLVNGLASQGIESGTIIGRYALMSMLHTYFRTGDKTSSSTSTSVFKNRSIMIERTVIQDSTNSNNAKLTPRDGVEIKPTNYSSGLPIIWKTSWKKWDGTNYSKDYADTWAEQKVAVKYNVLVSTDNRGTWKYLQTDNTLSTENATAGVFNPNSNYVFTPSSSGDTDNKLGVSTKLKIGALDGSVIFRIEGHRFDTSVSTSNPYLIPTNYSYHERTISINRL